VSSNAGCVFAESSARKNSVLQLRRCRTSPRNSNSPPLGC
jgi:hypothetical protein